jgi:predicted Zn-dependent protease
VAPELVRLLTEIGLMGAGHGCTADADAIFEALMAARPDSELPVVGAAMARLGAGQPEGAVQLLRDKALKINPASDDARSLLGLALRFAGRAAESQAVLRELAETGKDPKAVSLARSLLSAP